MDCRIRLPVNHWFFVTQELAYLTDNDVSGSLDLAVGLGGLLFETYHRDSFQSLGKKRCFSLEASRGRNVRACCPNKRIFFPSFTFALVRLSFSHRYDGSSATAGSAFQLQRQPRESLRANHPLRRVAGFIDFTFIRAEVPDPKGDRVKVILNGKFLAYKKWEVAGPKSGKWRDRGTGSRGP
jgi:hypothetical protein